ncbi:Dimethylglycine oxidase [Diplonema papillatum]|nr:Dimethylglycine oxidase [Diplonema papillatum]|eukprot:gene1641-2450_t
MGLRRAAWIAGPVRTQALTKGVSVNADKQKNNFHDIGFQARRSALFDRLSLRGMHISVVNNGVSTMQRAHCFPTDDGTSMTDVIAQEYFACRTNAAIWDMSSFVKLRIDGPDACAELEHLCSLKVDRPVAEGRVVYCCLCNENGGVEADVTVLRVAEDSFYMVVGAELLRHVLAFLRSSFRPGAKATVTDVSDDIGVLCIAGPTSRKVLNDAVGNVDFSNDAFPFATAQRIDVHGIEVMALRVCFMGDLGWELHCDMDDLPRLYEVVCTSAKKYGVKDAGYACLANLRTEKMFLHWGKSMRVGVEVTAEETPLELGFPVKKAEFIASAALEQQRADGVKKRLVTIVPEDQTDLRFEGHEVLLRNGEEAGLVCTTAYSFLLEKPVAIGWVHRKDGGTASWKWALDADARHEVVLKDGSRLPVTLSKRSAFDADGSRMRS